MTENLAQYSKMSVDLALEIESLKAALVTVNDTQAEMEERLDGVDERHEEMDETDEKLESLMNDNKSKIEEVEKLLVNENDKDNQKIDHNMLRT
jgi:septal ring factor EnvC (AmiA/AmiB activator)